MNTSRVVAAVIMVAAVPALSACGGRSHTATSPARPSPRVHVEIEDELGFDREGILARESRVEAKIRDCMKAHGFRYIPVDPVARRTAVTGDAGLSDEEFVMRFGYGISTLWGRGATADANLALRDHLSARRRRAYDRTLWGSTTGATFEEAVDSGAFTRLGGCTRRATAAVFGGTQVLTRLVAALDELDDQIVRDPRMVRALRRWSSCMRSAGLEYTDPDDVDEDLLRQMRKIVGAIPGAFVTRPVDDRRPRGYDRAALAALQRREVATARRDLNCERRHVWPVESLVRPPYEARFRRRNAALIAQVKPVR